MSYQMENPGKDTVLYSQKPYDMQRDRQAHPNRGGGREGGRGSLWSM